ncbi:MAG: thioredoxin family protein, partial [Oscillospiraceae bacterium]|nr:thioredoxin family protein [Oscillospiraceae bacterium]
SHVTILIRRDDFSCAKSVADATRAHPKITVLTNTEVVDVSGDSTLRAIRYRNKLTGEVTEHRAPEGDNIGVFVFAGYAPATALIRDLAELTPDGYVVTDRSQKTTVEGLYAAGDVCVKALRQVVTAVGDGALAATELEKYAASLQKKTGLVPEKPAPKAPAPVEEAPKSAAASSGALFDEAMLTQLNTVFSRMAQPLVLKLSLDERPVSAELKGYMEELAALTDKLSVEVSNDAPDAPCVRLYRADGSWTGLAFHGVPGGHEFTSFVLGLYNAAGPGQALDADVVESVRSLGKKEIKVLVSLSCTMCPELVTAAQRIAAENENVSAEVYDLNHFPAIRDRYNVMSVPCLVVGDGEVVSFGKKNVRQLLEVLNK